VTVNGQQVARIVQLLAGLPAVPAFPFTGPHYPPVDQPGAVDFFFAATLQQFGFWTHSQGRYNRPLIAPIDGHDLKGSDYLWRAYLRPLAEDPSFFSPERQASLTRQEMLDLFRADDGSDPLPALDLHLEQARHYGQDMLALGLTPSDLLRKAQASSHPLRAFVTLLDHVGGYKEDPLRKKTVLLAVILNQRPESYLPFGSGEGTAPVIDYHLMRACLRMGLLQVHDEKLLEKLAGRRLLIPVDEWTVRQSAYEAVRQVAERSGVPAGAVDNWFFFTARGRCPEMTEPQCDLCPADPICAHRKELFQPVIRTTFY
jgi:hypothetical protein